MFWTQEKLAARIKEIEGMRYREELMIEGMTMKSDPGGEIGAYPTAEGEEEEIRVGDRWVGRDTYIWLTVPCSIPAHWQGKKILGRFDFGRTGGGNNSGFESLLFINGQPYQGVDSNHKEVFLPEDTAGSWLKLQFRLWSGLNGYGKAEPIEHRIAEAKLCWLDEAADDLYYTSRAVLETVAQLEESRPEHHELLAALDRALLLIDWSEPGSEIFYQSVALAADKLRQQLEAMPKHSSIVVSCVGHTHIDVAWLWRIKHTREKSARSFSTVLRLMEMYPEYLFLQTQPQLYEYLKEDYPAIYEQIQQRVKEGRWEAGGAMWLEADCNLASGESLVRQLLYGTRFLREEFGVECRYLWLPDVFGYSWALPQILQKSGIELFMTTKISWNQYNRMPHDTFKWRGIDGSEILTHFITTPDPGTSEGAFYYTYNGSVTPETVQGIWEAYQDKDLNQELLLAYGYGDGGGGVNREMLEMRRRLENMPGLPKVTTGRADEYFSRLQERIASTDRYVHTWNGELYLELHRGTYTSQAANKRANRKLELRYRETEWMAVLNSLHHTDWGLYPRQPLDQGWKIILRNQFHDIIPGSSIGEVYQDSKEEYEQAFQLADEAWSLAAQGIAAVPQEDIMDQDSALEKQKELIVTLFNSSPWKRNDIVVLEEGLGWPGTGWTWTDSQGRTVASQKTGGHWLLDVQELPAMGYTIIHGSPAAVESGETPFAFNEQLNQLVTPFYELEWNDKGQLVRLYDRIASRNVLAEGQNANVFQVFEDKPKSRHEAWDIDIFYQEKMRIIDNLTRVSVEETGPVRTVVRFEWAYGHSVICQKMIVYASHRRIDFETKVDWHEQRQLLKVAFPVNIHAAEAAYDIQFGNVKRPTHWNTSWDYARFESVGHMWADLSERDYGVSLLNDCKYGYDIKDNVLRLSLIKSAMVPDPQADQGEHRFTYALFPHEGDWAQGGTVESAWKLNNPVTAIAGRPDRESLSLLKLSHDHVMIDAVKKGEDEDAVLVRLHEFKGQRGIIALDSDLAITAWQEVNLMERPVQGEPVWQSGPVSFPLKPYEIKTFILQLQKK